MRSKKVGRKHVFRRMELIVNTVKKPWFQGLSFVGKLPTISESMVCRKVVDLCIFVGFNYILWLLQKRKLQYGSPS